MSSEAHAHGHGTTDLAKLPGAAPDPHATSTFVLGVMGTLITVVTILFVTIIYRHQAHVEVEMKILERGNQALDTMRKRQRKELEGAPRPEVLPDKTEKPRRGIPIDRAMQLVKAEKQGN